MTKKLTRITDLILRQHAALVLCLHIGIVCLSLLLSWLLRFEFRFQHPIIVVSAAPILVLIRVAAMRHFRLLHGHWRYTGINDVADIVRATTVGSAVFLVVIRFVLGVVEFPLSIFVLEAVFTATMVAGVRALFRVMAEAASRLSSTAVRRQVLIIGAGFAANMVTRELQHSSSGYWVVGCVDDDRSKVGLRIHGKPVLGTVDQLSEIASQHSVTEVVIAVPSASGPQMRRFVRLCEEAHLKFSTVPSLPDLISGKAKIIDVREVNLNDLLGRDPVRIDLQAVQTVLENKVVLVTGAAGSIGSELCRQILRYRPAKLVCVDQSETGLFYLEMELGPHNTVYCVADYANTERMKRIFATHRVQIVFHAGAYKHVPLMEANPREALENNVFGLLKLLRVAEASDCGTFVMISSDKAVSPTNVMGATKRMGELILASRTDAHMRCVSVRFGNVLGSQGSVVPIFQKQIAEHGRVTITHPDITRFFMTISEAVSLVLEASAIGKHGDVLVLDMGEPIRIVDLARTLIRLSGKTEQEVEIAFTGLRPGEKLFEELFYPDEEAFPTTCDKIKRTSTPRVNWDDLRSKLDEIKATMFHISDIQVRSKVQEIVPEYTFEGDPFADSAAPVAVELPRISSQYASAAGDD